MKNSTACFFLLLFFFSCKKESFIGDRNAVLNLSTDSLYFDTLFTNTGSVTQLFKLYNENDRKLRISHISVSNGSFFRINADGRPGPQVSDLEIAANDSLYVFVSVLINPSASDLPFIIEDSISIEYNGNTRWVKLSAWGQNAHFMNASTISTHTTWSAERPYVILGGLTIAENTVLTIEKGVRIYLHADAPLLVNGTIRAVGERYDSTKIVFQGDRLDRGYRDYPGAWPGIYFGSNSQNNLLKHVVINNAYQGVVVENPSEDMEPKVILEECIIDNCYDAGIICSRSSLRAVNTLVSNCGKNIVLLHGGEYEFVHCTNVAISNSFIQHKEPVLRIAANEDMKADFTNCIFWGEHGTVDNEVVLEQEGSNLFDLSFTNCLRDQDPLFNSIDTRERLYNFRLQEGSPALNAGVATGTVFDLDGNERDLFNPDIGAYEQ